MKKRFPKIISALLAVVMILGAMPLSAFAAAASDLPENMTADAWTKAQIILKTMEIGLKQIENQYSKHIQVSFKEV